MEWSIQQVAVLAGVTSRTLRHYDDIGLVPPSRVGRNGYRYYDEHALVRLQRALLLRELGLALPQIGRILDRGFDEVSALGAHLSLLNQEQERIASQIAAVEHTIAALQKGRPPMAEQMFEGFDHAQYKDEVEHRWGQRAYAQSDAWWRGLSDDERAQWKAKSARLIAEWAAAAADVAVGPDSPQAQALAGRQVEWLTGIPGTPAAEQGGDLEGYVGGLAAMYVADDRFAAKYGGVSGATFVRDALLAYLDRR